MSLEVKTLITSKHKSTPFMGKNFSSKEEESFAKQI